MEDLSVSLADGLMDGLTPDGSSDPTLINSFSIHKINHHIESLNQSDNIFPSVLKAKCLDILKEVMQHQFGWVFNSPVDPVELALPDYFSVIKKPMDLGTVKSNVETSNYHSINSFKSDCHLAFDNALIYNDKESDVYCMALEIKEHFNREYDKVLKEIDAEQGKKCDNREAKTQPASSPPALTSQEDPVSTSTTTSTSTWTSTLPPALPPAPPHSPKRKPPSIPLHSILTPSKKSWRQPKPNSHPTPTKVAWGAEFSRPTTPPSPTHCLPIKSICSPIKEKVLPSV
ncbi:hypothetical protein TrLO_g5591 [Triparma laevis f. longispina]|uniref:Bromo domain-containing protein n=1 Tax=Triparma laevis f. longispina TaxID=1714387 RepID=A0A9W7ABG4_9STRA|nr:hypothetical protein TrLO_g5591 [Triparma laevis f. longispina]